MLVVIFNIEHAHSIMRAKFEKFSNKNQSLSLSADSVAHGKERNAQKQGSAKVVSTVLLLRPRMQIRKENQVKIVQKLQQQK